MVLAVAACAIVVHLGALSHGLALDDTYIIAGNPLVRSWDGIWRAFGQPYWLAPLGSMYRPLAIATFGVDWMTGLGAAWFHAVNLLWHAAASVAVAVLTRRWAGPVAALVAGLLFAVHPVHVEAVANVVGRADLMAAIFVMLAVYAALVRGSVAWSTAALLLGLLSKENAAVAPGLIAWGWIVGLAPRPSRSKAIIWVASWTAVGLVYWAVRARVLSPFEGFANLAPIFLGASWLEVRLTAVAALADVVRLLLFPVTLRVEYTPAERTLVTTPLDPRFALGLLCLVALAGALAVAWRRGRKVEAFGLGWVGIAFLPVANLLFPAGVLVAERTLYLPSVGLVVAAGALFTGLEAKRRVAITALLVALGALRSALRVPVWRHDGTVALSVLEDSPRSYRGPMLAGGIFMAGGEHGKALDAFQKAIEIFDRGHTLFIGAATAAMGTGRWDLARTYMDRADALCRNCPAGYVLQAAAARTRGDSIVADSLLARARRVGAAP